MRHRARAELPKHISRVSVGYQIRYCWFEGFEMLRRVERAFVLGRVGMAEPRDRQRAGGRHVPLRHRRPLRPHLRIQEEVRRKLLQVRRRRREGTAFVGQVLLS